MPSPTAEEFRVLYAGIIPEIPVDLDPSSRTELLKLIDESKLAGNVSPSPKDAEPVVFRIDPYAVHLTSLVTRGQSVMSVPIHMLAAVCFVQDESMNILGLKIGEVGNNPDVNDLVVLYCDTLELAEDVCNSLQKCFQRVFAEAMMQVGAKKTAEGAAPAMSFLETTVSSEARTFGREMPSFFSGSRSELNRVGSARDKLLTAHYSSTTTQSDSDGLSQCVADYIHEYMLKLHATLTQEELNQFAQLLKRWRSDSLPIAEFIQKVSELYGAERKHLLAKMGPFIGEKDRKKFEEFLAQSGITADDNAYSHVSYGASTELSSPGTRRNMDSGSQYVSTVDLDNASEVSIGKDTLVGNTETTESSTLEDNHNDSCTDSNASTIPLGGTPVNKSRSLALPPEPLTPAHAAAKLPDGARFSFVTSDRIDSASAAPSTQSFYSASFADSAETLSLTSLSTNANSTPERDHTLERPDPESRLPLRNSGRPPFGLTPVNIDAIESTSPRPGRAADSVEMVPRESTTVQVLDSPRTEDSRF